MKFKLSALFAAVLAAALAFSGCGLRVQPNPDSVVTADTTENIPDAEADEPDDEPADTADEPSAPDVEDPVVEEPTPPDEPVIDEPTEPTEPTEPETVDGILSMDTVMYANANVNVRSGPGTSYGRLGHLEKGEAANVTGKHLSSGWYRISFKDGEGFVSGEYLDEVGDETPAVD